MLNANRSSAPSALRITDIRFADIVGAPMSCTLIRISTNEGIEGYGEVRDGADRLYAEMLIRHLIGQNPCDVNRLYQRIKQFGGHARQGGGVSGIEVALWDLAGKAYGIPAYQLLGGRQRDSVRIYCDTDSEGSSGREMGKRLKERMRLGYTFLKMDLGINLLYDVPGALTAPLGFIEDMRASARAAYEAKGRPDEELRALRSRAYDMQNIMHPFTFIEISDMGLDILEQYVNEVRSEIGYEVPLAIDHVGHIGITSAIRLGRRLEKYSIAWLEDLVPWQFTDMYTRLTRECAIPICTGEDIFLKEGFLPLLQSGAVGAIHPDVLTCGGMLELRAISDAAFEYGVPMAIHMAETPVGALAAAHVATASANFVAEEYHSVDVPWWDSLVSAPSYGGRIVRDGFIKVSDAPGLGIESLCDEVIREHISPASPVLWEDTSCWVKRHSHDRLWS